MNIIKCPFPTSGSCSAGNMAGAQYAFFFYEINWSVCGLSGILFWPKCKDGLLLEGSGLLHTVRNNRVTRLDESIRMLSSHSQLCSQDNNLKNDGPREGILSPCGPLAARSFRNIN